MIHILQREIEDLESKLRFYERGENKLTDENKQLKALCRRLRAGEKVSHSEYAQIMGDVDWTDRAISGY
jgi:hypothetical protein